MNQSKSGSFKLEDAVTCESCRYRVSGAESRFIDCEDCGSYHLCDYCFNDFKDKKDQEFNSQLQKIKQEDSSDEAYEGKKEELKV